MDPDRRRFLIRFTLAATAAASSLAAFPRRLAAAILGPSVPGPSRDRPLVLRRRPRRPRVTWASFPVHAEERLYGAGTYQTGGPELFARAFSSGVRLVAVSPDYNDGANEEWVGEALESARNPVFVMTQIPIAAWRAENRQTAMARALRRSLGRLRRERVEALLVRNAEPDQLRDPAFRAFARNALDRGLVGRVGASGHGRDVEPVLAAALEDELIRIVLFGAHLAGTGEIPALLPAARHRGILLVAMKTREAALWGRAEGWEAEARRRRFAPWDGAWDPGFTRRALARALDRTPAHNAVLSLHRPEDLAAILGS
jgi:aryl-alcohol dehydrogenase-like predicted oxidoreductase